MGAQLMSFYEKANAMGAVKAQMRLAMKSGIPSSKASVVPDTPENIQKMAEALKSIEAEFK